MLQPLRGCMRQTHTMVSAIDTLARVAGPHMVLPEEDDSADSDAIWPPEPEEFWAACNTEGWQEWIDEYYARARSADAEFDALCAAAEAEADAGYDALCAALQPKLKSDTKVRRLPLSRLEVMFSVSADMHCYAVGTVRQQFCRVSLVSTHRAE